MTSLPQDVRDYIAPRWRLGLGALLSFILYPVLMVVLYEVAVGIFEFLTGLNTSPPVIDFMSNYSRDAQNGYWVFVTLSILIIIIIAAILPTYLGSSAGQYCLGIRYLDTNGNRVAVVQTIKKTMFYILLFLLIAIPGPVIGFYLDVLTQDTRNIASLACLLVGILVTGIVLFKVDISRRTMIYRFCGIVPVSKKNLHTVKLILKNSAEPSQMKYSE